MTENDQFLWHSLRFHIDSRLNCCCLRGNKRIMGWHGIGTFWDICRCFCNTILTIYANNIAFVTLTNIERSQRIPNSNETNQRKKNDENRLRIYCSQLQHIEQSNLRANSQLFLRSLIEPFYANKPHIISFTNKTNVISIKDLYTWQSGICRCMLIISVSIQPLFRSFLLASTFEAFLLLPCRMFEALTFFLRLPLSLSFPPLIASLLLFHRIAHFRLISLNPTKSLILIILPSNKQFMRYDKNVYNSWYIGSNKQTTKKRDACWKYGRSGKCEIYNS